MAVDRSKTTPFLLKLFYRTGNFHRTDEFASTPLPPCLHIYTWSSCTLHELSELVHSALPTALPSPAVGTRLAFRSVFPDIRGSSGDRSRGGTSSLLSSSSQPYYFYRDLGSVVIGEGGKGASGPDSLDENPDSQSDSGSDRDARSSHRRKGRNDSRSRSRSIRSRSKSPTSRSRRHRPDSPSLSTAPTSATLAESGFKPGDYISCAVFPPLPNGHVPGPPAATAGVGHGSIGLSGHSSGQSKGRSRDDSGPSARGFGRQSLLNDNWRRGEAPPPPTDVYSRGGVGYWGDKRRRR